MPLQNDNTAKCIKHVESVYIIAEIGSNHNQDLSTALKLIDEAVAAKVDAVKFQLFKGERHYSKFTPMFDSLSEHPVDLLKKIQLPETWISELKKYSDHKGVDFICSVTSMSDVDLLERNQIDMIKIASFEIVDLPLIRYAAQKGKWVLISTGMANLEEIEDAYLACVDENNPNIVFFQCASAYPAPPGIVNLNAITTLKTAFPDTIVGLSDHTTGTAIASASVALGAKVIEKHFTLDKKMTGPDHHFALDPKELSRLVKDVRDVEAALGNGLKLGPTHEETEYYSKARRSLHARIDIAQGETITKEHLIIKRPGFGIKPKFLDIVKNRKAVVDIKKDEWITWDKI